MSYLCREWLRNKVGQNFTDKTIIDSLANVNKNKASPGSMIHLGICHPSCLFAFLIPMATHPKPEFGATEATQRKQWDIIALL